MFNFPQKYNFIVGFLCYNLIFTHAHAQITIDSSKTIQQLVSDVLLGSGVSVSNITYNGNPSAIGYFDGTNSNLGIDSGIVLTSGNISGVPGPNNSGSTSTGWYGPGDADLDGLTTATTEDASVLEFDFIPGSAKVKFRYVFGSEEYMEWAGSSFNDVFGFFISGPGITGKPNIALIPGTSTPVTINNVNLITNLSYYFDNENPIGVTVQYDGFTTVLEAEVTVIPCEMYHIKIAVADAGDAAYDSGVFLEAGSFESGISAAYLISEAANDSSMYESCSASELIFTRSGALDSTQTVQLNYGGTAQNGIDYTLIPDSFVFPVGVDTVILSFSAIGDGVTEGTETVIIDIINELCDDSVSFTVSVNIIDVLDLIVVAMPDTNLCSGDSVLLTAEVSGGINGQYEVQWENYLPGDTMIYGNGGTYIVHVTDSCGRTDSDTLEITSLAFLSGYLYDYQSDTVVNFYANTADSILFWNFGDGTTSVESNPVHSYNNAGVYSVSLAVINEMGCIDTIVQQITVEIVDPYNIFIPNSFTPDGDGLNDIFIAKGENIKTFEMYIYNRWGEVVYSTTDLTQAWNGKTAEENEAMKGVYVYLMKVSNTRDEEYIYRGSVSLIR